MTPDTKTCFKIKRCNKNEDGSVIILSLFFIISMFSLLALSIDGFFLLQSRLEEQNLSEYFAMAALAGYERADITDSDDEFISRRDSSLDFLQSMEGTNSVIGLKDSGWDFSQDVSCSGIQCEGAGWKMVFGQWVHEGNSGSFTPGQVDPNDPEYVDSTSINAVQLMLGFKKKSLIQFFNTTFGESSDKISTSSIAYLPLGGRKVIRIAKFST